MELKTTRKNRFRKQKAPDRALLRRRARVAVKALLGSLALLAASAAFIFAHDYFTQSPHFQVRRVEVAGQQRLSREEILDIAGIGPQTNILALNLNTARRRLLAAPWIADAAISRDIPSTLRITVREESPLAVLAMADGGGFLLNRAGRVFDRVAGTAKGSWPEIQGLDPGDLPVAGACPTRAFSAVMQLLRLADGKKQPSSLAGIQRIAMDRDVGATVYLEPNERCIKLGFGGYEEKATVLDRLVAHIEDQRPAIDWQCIDLVDVNRIVVTPAAPGASEGTHEEVNVAGT